jgi:hypothetical protein
MILSRIVSVSRRASAPAQVSEAACNNDDLRNVDILIDKNE